MSAELAGESGRLTELRDLTERGRHREVADLLAAMPEAEVASRAPLALLAAEAYGRLGEYDASERWATAALAIAQERGDHHAEVRALNDRGVIALERGDGGGAERWLLAALERCRFSKDYAAQARCFNNLGIVANLKGDIHGALVNYELARAAYQQAGFVRGLAETHHNIAISRLHLGDVSGALGAAEQAVRLAEQLADERLAAQALAGRAEMHLARGDVDLASVELERVEAAYTRLQHPVGLAEAWRLRGRVAGVRGDLPQAIGLFTQAADLARQHGSAHTLAEIERDLAAAFEAAGDEAAARAARGRALEIYRRLGAEKAANELAG